jgi:hypothetical protein
MSQTKLDDLMFQLRNAPLRDQVKRPRSLYHTRGSGHPAHNVRGDAHPHATPLDEHLDNFISADIELYRYVRNTYSEMYIPPLQHGWLITMWHGSTMFLATTNDAEYSRLAKERKKYLMRLRSARAQRGIKDDFKRTINNALEKTTCLSWGI